MAGVDDFIRGHEHGGDHVLEAYVGMLRSYRDYVRITGDMDSLKGTGDWILPHMQGGRVVAVELVDGDEPFIGSLGNEMMRYVHDARIRLEHLMDSGWGNLPLMAEVYQAVMRQPFPKGYKGHDVPAEYQTIDSYLLDPPDRMLPPGR